MIRPEDDWRQLESYPARRHCAGGRVGSYSRCGLPATVVCTLADFTTVSNPKMPARWYACALAAHQQGAATEPIDSFLERCVRKRAVDILSQDSP